MQHGIKMIAIYTSVSSVGAAMGQDDSYVHLQALLMQQDQA